ncbi:hypothetical protein MKW92_052793 [Papaver armeniacum]|nr:hypothetical protein MKW92_052793 [Papaver armeniacum]
MEEDYKMVLTAISYDPERKVKKEKKEIDERTAAAYARLIETARHIDEEIYKEQQLRKLEKENNNLESEVDVNVRDRDAEVIVRRKKFPETFRGKEYKKQVYEPLSTMVGDPKDGVKTIVDAMW